MSAQRLLLRVLIGLLVLVFDGVLEAPSSAPAVVPTYGHDATTYAYDAPVVLSSSDTVASYERASRPGPEVVSRGSSVVVRGCCVAASAGARTFGNFAVNDLRVAAQAADRNGLTQVGRALQKHSGRDGSVFNGLSNGTATARKEQGLRVLDDILNDPAGHSDVLDRVTNIWDSTGRGVRYGNDGSFMGFLEPVG